MPRIIHSKWFHRILQVCRLPALFRFGMRVITPRFKHKGIKFRFRSPESYSIAQEIFWQPTYETLLSQTTVRNFLDLGCNTGFFTCLLASRYGNQVKGVLVDADEDVLKETNWHLSANKLENCQSMCALIGPADCETADFFVSDFNISSSAKGFDDAPFPLRTVETVQRPVVSLQRLLSTFGDERVEVVKIDIEGSEADLLKQDLSCLTQVDWIVIEWHKWVLQLDDMTTVFEQNDFTLETVLKEDSICGLALYRNKERAVPANCLPGQ